MELEELKQIWTEAEKALPATNGSEVVKQSMRVTSGNIFQKMKRNLFYEVVLVLLATVVVAVYYFTAFEGYLYEVSWLYIGLATIFIIYYYQKGRLLNKIENAGMNVKATMQHQLSTLEKWVRLYLLAGTMLVPLVMGFFYWVLQDNLFIIRTPISLPVSSRMFALFYGVLTAIFTVGLYLFHKWYIYQLYGRHIKKLKALVAEMQETL